jgi:hypothetical protein
MKINTFMLGTSKAVYRCTELKRGKWLISIKYVNSKAIAKYEISENWAETRVCQFIFELDKLDL